MFCAKCGKEIDNDSTFCPFCGQRTDEPVEGGGGSNPQKSVKMPGKKVTGGIAVVAVVLLVVFGISRGISNRSRSLPEKLFAMSWEERSEVSEDDIKDMLDESDIFYDMEERGSGNVFFTGTTEPFMKGDCLFEAVPGLFEDFYFVRYKTEEDFKEGRKQLESTLEKQLINKMDSFEATAGYFQARYYPVGVSDKYRDRYLDQVDFSISIGSFDGIYDFVNDWGKDYDEIIDADRNHETKYQYSIYKFVYVVYCTADELPSTGISFLSDKSYIDQMCLIGTIYIPAYEGSIISTLASQYNYDAISGKEIDIDEFKESVDEELVDAYLDENASDDPERRRELEKELYISLYMKENHNFDINSKTYIESEWESPNI